MGLAVLPLPLMVQFDDPSNGTRRVIYHRMPSEPAATADTRRAAFLGPNRPTGLARATLLARAYFDRHLGGCGFPEPGQDAGDRWAFPTRVGYIGSPGPEIQVDKRPGTTTASNLPTVTNPSATYGPQKFDAKAAAIREREYVRRTGGLNGVLLAAAKIGPRQEIGEYEAWVMARAYFSTRFGPCGGAAMPRRTNRFWIVHTVRGAAARPGPDVLIDRRTGDTWAKGAPHIAAPRVYAKLVSR